jgi:hypothetical protein
MRHVQSLAILAVAGLATTGSAQSVWTIDPTPVVDVAGALPGGRVNFALAAGATRLSDGSLLIADRGGSAVHLFDPSGKHINSDGRAGEGPGEFRTMVWAGRCGVDTLLVWDPRLRRGTFVGKSGTLARHFQLSEAGVPRALWFSCGAAGTLAFLSEPTGRRASPVPNVIQMEANVVVLDRDGRLVTNHGQVGGGEWFSPGRGAFPRPLGTTSSIAMVGSSLVVGTGDSAAVVVIAPSGTRRTVGVPGQRRAPTREEFDEAVQAIASVAPGEVRQAAIDGLSRAPIPALLPPYASIFSDPMELLWVQLSPTGAKQVDFVVMQLDGRIVARVRLPRSLTVYEIGRDYVLGAYADDDDEMHVAVYRLRR